MPKRKQEDETNEGVGGVVGAKAQRVRHKLQQGTVKLGHAFKVAKGFERQKLGRRRKKALASTNPTDVQRIDAEAAAVKTLDTSAFARVHLHRLLSKIKAVAGSPNLPPEVHQSATLSTDTAVLNVHARLCNSNPVKEALPAILTDIQQALGVRVRQEDVVSKGRLRAKDHEALAIGTEGNGSRSTEPASQELSEDVESEGRGCSALAGGDTSDGELERYNDRLASSDEESEKDEEDLDAETIERRLEKEGVGRKSSKASQVNYDHTADLELSDDDAASASPSPEPRKGPAPKKPAFLPSLSMGGYISGSDSDIDNADEAPRKNRRGQRARQQIWEKKFGAKAQHLQKQERDKGRDPKRGATDGDDRRGKGKWFERGGKEKPVRRSDVIDKRPAVEAKIKHRDDSGPIHPSWAAAKMAKEKKAAPAAFQGKKITFE